MSDRVNFLMTFRGRLTLLLSSILLLTIVVVIALDGWARRRADRVIRLRNSQVSEAANAGYGDLAQGMALAMQSLNSENYLYQVVEEQGTGLPRTIKSITVASSDGIVADSTSRELVDKIISLPDVVGFSAQSIDPATGEGVAHEQSYYHPVTTVKGLYWIVIETTQESLMGEIQDATERLAAENRELSDYRLAATAGVLVIGLGLAVIIGWRFTKPIGALANAAREVADGQLEFHVNVNRRDELGELATNFNEMISGLKAKRELEEKLRHAEREAVIGRLTQSVAHEIRNPLNVINLSIDHVRSRYAPDDEIKRGQFTGILSSIKDELNRLNHLVNDLLNYGRPAQLTVQTLDVRDLLKETVTLVEPQAVEQGVDINVDMDGSPAEIRGDKERLKSCFSNIAINALQAMPSGGKLSAAVRKVNGFVEVSISDTGVGMTPDHREKIFEPYFSTKQTGFGLGLAVTKKVVDEHKGSIDVESEPGQGTTFKVRLPIDEGKQAGNRSSL